MVDKVKDKEIADAEKTENEKETKSVEDGEEDETESSECKEKSDKKSVKEDLNVLFGDETLSEEFKNKAETIFEAAVNLKVETLKESLEKEYETKLDEAKANITDKIDSFLDIVVSEWLVDNHVAIESGRRVAMAEAVLSSVKNIFVENNVELPEDKVDLFDEMTKEKNSLQEQVELLTKEIAEKNDVIFSKEKDSVFAEISEGLADTQIEKFKTLAGDIDVSDIETFKSKLTVIRESFFKQPENEEDKSKETLVETKKATKGQIYGNLFITEQ